MKLLPLFIILCYLYAIDQSKRTGQLQCIIIGFIATYSTRIKFVQTGKQLFVIYLNISTIHVNLHVPPGRLLPQYVKNSKGSSLLCKRNETHRGGVLV